MQDVTSFRTTCWALIGKASSGDEKQQALDEVIRVYWYPLYAFCRRQGYSDHDSMDCTQGFLTSLLESDTLSKAEEGRGRFRNFLLVSFKNYLNKQLRHSLALRRGGSVVRMPLDSLQFSARYCQEVWDPAESPDRVYERQCIVNFLKCVEQKLSESYARAGKQELFDQLSPLMLNSDDSISRSELVEKLNMSPAAINMALRRMRLKFAQLLRSELSRHIGQGETVEEELKELLRIVAK